MNNIFVLSTVYISDNSKNIQLNYVFLVLLTLSTPIIRIV